MSEELHLGQPEISDEDPNSHIKIKEELYDHGSITKRDQLVVEECLKFIDPGLHDEVKEKFEKLLSENKGLSKDRVAKINKVAGVLEEFNNMPLSENMIKKLFFIQDLAEEL